MVIIPSIAKITALQVYSGSWAPADSPVGYEDVKRFVNADREKDYLGLLRDYSAPLQPLFGFSDRGSEQNRGAFFEDDLDDPTSVKDVMNVGTLLRAGLELCSLIDMPYASKEALESRGLKINEMPWGACSVSMTLKIAESHETLEFIETGGNKVTRANTTFALSKMPYHPDGHPWYMFKGEFMDFGKSNPNTHDLCSGLLDSLSALMLHDVSIRIEDRALSIVSGSVVSSLWWSMIDASRKGRVGRCEVCDTPFIATSDRKNKRLYCSERCNKKHQRLVRFRELISQGRSGEEAAKRAGVALNTAQEYWSHHI